MLILIVLLTPVCQPILDSPRPPPPASSSSSTGRNNAASSSTLAAARGDAVTTVPNEADRDSNEDEGLAFLRRRPSIRDRKKV